ncbi:hypothetical protein HK099_002966, partial [Clydaea vesicula]
MKSINNDDFQNQNPASPLHHQPFTKVEIIIDDKNLAEKKVDQVKTGSLKKFQVVAPDFDNQSPLVHSALGQLSDSNYVSNLYNTLENNKANSSKNRPYGTLPYSSGTLQNKNHFHLKPDFKDRSSLISQSKRSIYSENFNQLLRNEGNDDGTLQHNSVLVRNSFISASNLNNDLKEEIHKTYYSQNRSNRRSTLGRNLNKEDSLVSSYYETSNTDNSTLKNENEFCENEVDIYNEKMEVENFKSKYDVENFPTENISENNNNDSLLQSPILRKNTMSMILKMSGASEKV